MLDGLAVWLLDSDPKHFKTGEREARNILCDGEFTKVVANHLGLDLNLVELLSGVDTDDAADHLGDNDHVTQVGLDEVGLLVGLGLLLGLAELLDQAHGLALQTTVEPAAGAGVHDIAELFGGEVEEPVAHSMSDNGSFKCSPICPCISTLDSDKDDPCKDGKIDGLARSESGGWPVTGFLDGWKIAEHTGRGQFRGR